jgi:lysophospholipase L1-like esterase
MTHTHRSKPAFAHTALTPSDTILAVGDSLTLGYGTYVSHSYPAVLERLTGLRVINAGRNGETSQEGLRRLPKLLDTHRPALTLLCYGGNDLLRNLPPSRLKRNLLDMISMIRASGSDVLLIGVPHLTLLGVEPYELYEEVAEETSTPLLNDALSSVLNDPKLKSDAVHPNASGYRLLAERIYEKLRQEGWIR